MLRYALDALTERQKDQIRKFMAIVPVSCRQPPVYWKWRAFLQIAKRWDHEKINKWKLERLKRVVNHAFSNTEGYFQLYREAGIAPSDIRCLSDIRHLPFTTKELIRDNLKLFSTNDKGPKLYVTTGGSTGIPFGFYLTRENRQIESAFMHTGWNWAGWKLGQRSVVLRGGYVGSEEKIWKYDSFHRELLLSSYYLNEQSLVKYIDAIKKFGPPSIQAYPSSLNLLSDLLIAKNLIGEVKFEVILLGSENVYAWQLEKFKRVFPEAKIFSWYGHAEQVVLAPWCEHSEKNHIWPYYGLTEILNHNDDEVEIGAEGEIIGTGFHNFITPFIRYRTMDRAVRGQKFCCYCERPYELLERISGRSHEVVVTKNGRYISMTSINMHDEIFDQLKQFQLFQSKLGVIEFRYIPKKTLNELEKQNIYSGLKFKFGYDVDLTLHQVEEIPRTKNGKYRFLVQELEIRYGDKDV